MNEKSLAPSMTPGQLNLPDVVQKARSPEATVLADANGVNVFAPLLPAGLWLLLG